MCTVKWALNQQQNRIKKKVSGSCSSVTKIAWTKEEEGKKEKKHSRGSALTIWHGNVKTHVAPFSFCFGTMWHKCCHKNYKITICASKKFKEEFNWSLTLSLIMKWLFGTRETYSILWEVYMDRIYVFNEFYLYAYSRTFWKVLNLKKKASSMTHQNSIKHCLSNSKHIDWFSFI